MLKLIGYVAIIWALFYFGIAQLIAIYMILGLSFVATFG